jgi:hypothetical protein
MADPTFKVVVTYAQFGASWTELYYKTASNITAAQAGLDETFAYLASVFRAAGTYVAGIRISNLLRPRESVLANLPVPTNLLNGQAPDPVTTAALWRLVSADKLANRGLWVRGLTDSSVVRDADTGQDKPSAALRNGLADFINQMVTAGLQIQKLPPIDGTSVFSYRVGAVVVAAGGATTLTLMDPITMGPSKKIILAGMDPKDWPGINGSYTVTALSTTSLQINYKARGDARTVPVSQGKIRLKEYTYSSIDPISCLFRKFGKHSTKSGPFGGRGAKRPARLRSR